MKQFPLSAPSAAKWQIHPRFPHFTLLRLGRGRSACKEIEYFFYSVVIILTIRQYEPNVIADRGFFSSPDTTEAT